MSRPLPIRAVQTPGSLYTVTESETDYGGRTLTATLAGTVWGDFRPSAPSTASTPDGDAYVVQEAQFICRSADGLAAGARLNLKGFDWTILSLDEQADGTVRLRLERVHA